MPIEKALIIDDSKLARVTLKKKLEAQGIEVLVSPSAEQGYITVAQEQPDLIFMDHLMPDVDGFEATQYLRQQGVKTPVIMCTGKEHDGYLDEALAVGANYILAKPPSDEALNQVLSMTFAPAVMTVDDFDLAGLDQAMEAVDDGALSTIDMDEMFDDNTPIEQDDDQALFELKPHAPDADVLAQLQALSAQVQQWQNQPSIDELQSQLHALQSALDESHDSASQADLNALRDVLVQEMQQTTRHLQKQLDDLPVAGSQSSDDRELLVRLEEILHPRLIDLKASLLSDMQSKLQNAREDGLDELLEIRLNVLLAERLLEFEQRIQSLEEEKSEALGDMPSATPSNEHNQSSHQRFKQSEKISKHLEQLIEENALFAKRIKQMRLLSIGAMGAAAISLLVSLVYFFAA